MNLQNRYDVEIAKREIGRSSTKLSRLSPTRRPEWSPWLELETTGVEFIDENGGGPGVRLRKPLRSKSKQPK